MDFKANYIKQNNQMDNFNLKKYLAEGKLKENFEFTENDIDEMQETAFFAGWNLSKKGGNAESAFEMWNSDSMEDLEEEYIGQFRSKSAENLGIAKANFSNAINDLDSKDISTAELAEETYLMLGNALKAHLDERFNR
tara:strand:- start:114 stop:527 length:414 start_codon:yes stop_codon:yes gene_type:complete